MTRRLTVAILCLAAVAVAALAAAAPAPRPVGPFRFVYGLERGGGFPALEALGLDTFYLDLLPSDLADLEPARGLIRAAHERGWRVIVGLPTTTPLRGRVRPGDAVYLGSVRETINYCTRNLGSEPGVTAWATGHYLEKSLQFTDLDFHAYLQAAYPSLQAVNDSWAATFPTWLDITQERARGVDGAQPHGVGRASVDVADFKAWAFGRVMQHWLDAIREVDPDRPVLTGRISLYRSLVSVPAGYDVVCVAMPPDVLEPDLYAHNVQALDLARRGGKFKVLPAFRCPHPSSEAYTEDRLRDWISLAAIHGAAGFGIDDWELLAPAYETERKLDNGRRVTETLRDSARWPWGQTPEATAAVLYSPYAAGEEVTAQPTYGYLRGFLPGEPSRLLQGLRLGSRYGVADCLTVSDCETANLERYGAVLAPACLRLPAAASEALSSYLERGGTLLADLGWGMYETGSWLALPERWSETFGVIGLRDLKDRAGDLRVGIPCPLLPSLQPGMVSRGLFNASRTEAAAPATARHAFTVGGPMALGQVADGAWAVAPAASDMPKGGKPVFGGLFANRAGSGAALFASHALWAHWPLDDRLATVLHGELLSRRPLYELLQPGLWQQGLHFSGNRQAVLLANLSRQAVLAQVVAYRAEGQVFAGAACRFVPSPVTLGYPAGACQLTVAVPGRGMAAAPRVPLVVQPWETSVTALVRRYGPEGVEVVVAGEDAKVTLNRGGVLSVQGLRAGRVRLVLSSGAYLTAPGSRHLVTVTSRGGRATETVVTADDAGRLDLSGSYRQDTLTVRPAP